MASDRIIQAVGRLERAVTRLEQASSARPARAGSSVDADRARAALRSLDELIAELKDRTHG
ncbi:MAG: hypothetical protein ABW048_13840 [Sphingobium sp.]